MNTHCADCKRAFDQARRRKRCPRCARKHKNAAMRTWRAANPAAVAAHARRYYEAHRPAVLAYHHSYYEDNRSKWKAEYDRNPEQSHAQVRRWRAKKDALGLCRICQKPRGEDGTKTRCRPCADEESRKAKARRVERRGLVPVANRDAVNVPYVVNRVVQQEDQ